MKCIEVLAPCFIKKVQNHAQFKPEILNSISSLGTFSINRNSEKILNTDFYMPSSAPRPYWNIVENDMKRFVLEVSSNFNAIHANINRYWFQQYAKGDFHDWHIHGESMFSCVYYVDLPENTKTTFKVLNKEFVLDVEEGDVLAFPSCFLHCSKPNPNDKIKTIISFNANAL